MIKIMNQKIDFRVIILALLIACIIGVVVPQLNQTGQVIVLLVLVFMAVVASFLAFRLSFDPAWVFILSIFFELVGFTVYSIKPGLTILWSIVLIPLPFAVISAFRHPEHIFPVLRDLWLWLALVCFAFMSLAWSPDSTYGLNKILILLVRGLIPGMYILLLYKINKTFSWQFVLIISIVYSIVLFIFGEQSSMYPGRFALLPDGNPILHARVCFLGAAVALWFHNGNLLLRLAVLALSIITALKTGSRGPLVAFIAANAIGAGMKHFADIFWQRLTWKKILMVGLIITSLVSGLLFVNSIDEELDFGRRYNVLKDIQDLMNDPNFSTRIDLQKEALDIFLKHPFLGVGLGGFAKLGSDSYPHNIVLEVAAEMGIIGLFLWCALIIRALIKATNNPLVFSLLLQAIFFALVSGDFGSNYEYVVISVLAIGLSPVYDRETLINTSGNLKNRGKT